MLLTFAYNYFCRVTLYAEQRDYSMKTISLRYGELSYVDRENDEYEYSDQFGLIPKVGS